MNAGKASDKTGWGFKEVQTPSDNLGKDSISILKLLFPFIVAGLFYLLEKLFLATIVAGIALAFLLLRFTAPSLLNLILTFLAALGRRLGKIVSYICLTIFYSIILVPIGLLNRLMGRDPLEFKWLPASHSYWVNLPQVDSVRFFDKPFLYEIRHSDKDKEPVKLFRFSKAVYNTALCLLILNLAIGLLYHKVVKTYNRKLLDPRSNSPVYAKSSWAKEYFREFKESNNVSYQPFIGWRRDDYSGKYINIKNGIRKSYQSNINPDKSILLYIFGGSTIWGTGARDDYTIPSYVAKFSERDHIPLKVKNFGETGFVNWQNVIRLSELCAEGNVPDLVIFYEGVNDLGAKLQTTYRDRVHQNLADWEERHGNWRRHDIVPVEVINWVKYNSLFHMIGRKLGINYRKSWSSERNASFEQNQIQLLAHDVVSTYAENTKFVKKLANAYDFKAWFYWQPTLYTRVNPTDFEREYQDSFKKGEYSNHYRATTMEIRLKNFAIDLSESFDNREETIYIDFAHISELGNQIIAERMYAQLIATLRTILNPTNRGQDLNKKNNRVP